MQQDLSSVVELVIQLCKHFYELGWMRFGSGSYCLKSGDQFLCPKDRVQREFLTNDDLALISLSEPESTQVELAPIFAYLIREKEAVAIIYSTSQAAVAISTNTDEEFVISDKEMIKGIPKGTPKDGYLSCFDTLRVPVIENGDVANILKSIQQVTQLNSSVNAVLIRGRGIIGWGVTWEKAKTQMECYDYLLETSFRLQTWL
ncbi:5'-methylthioribulose-1-phosphate dehydratase [Schizosaccharomyces japonicus yFS275]|uniref:5'-methylthioribulose-1-phosphate dehydratase n=1 Tax=Schizosaccharomyces japonicus (strain yFS275 / FY16936) TaxID=402676 RepID=B6K229_SCHJY|nr:5'-methylthioribulose-1-phosphate dehydratase [Schizosaccharomyces japonicus yFS275]EEB07210.2 5'-methylthioribulose-1-phosphate dehydratase [Schizosaccharomyces japonicus yFS275]